MDTILIVGLGNPGKRYEKTRHNAGFLALDIIHEALTRFGDINDWEVSKKFNAQIAGTTFHNKKIILAKPLTFMNRSGIAVQLIAQFYKIPRRHIIVLHDELDIALGQYKLQYDRGPAGHNGVKSIIEHIGGQDFHRLRIGIMAEDPKRMQPIADFVLKRFAFLEKRTLFTVLKTIADETLSLIERL